MMHLVSLMMSLMISSMMISGKDVMLSMPVTIDGIERELTMAKGESTDMAALSFAQNQGFVETLDESKLNQIVSHLSELLRRRLDDAAATRPMLFEIDMTVDQELTKLRAYEGQTSMEVLDAYFRDYGFSETLKDALLPQITQVLEARVAQFQRDMTTGRIVFSLPIVIGSETLVFEHHEGLEIEEETKAFVVAHIAREYQTMVFPEVLRLIQEEVMALEHGQISTSARPSVIFRVPVMINTRQYTVLVYEGYTIRDSAIQFLRDQGVTDESTAASYLPALIQVIEQKARQEASSSSVNKEDNQQNKETPILSIPLLMNQQQVHLDHFERQSPEISAKQFALEHGLEASEPGFQQTLDQLSALIRDQLQTSNSEQHQPLFAVPISLNETLYEMNFYPHDEPETAARDFCQQHQAQIVMTNETNVTTVESQLRECTSFLAETVISILNRLDVEAQKQEERPTEAQASPEPLFNLDINIGNDQVATIGFYAGNDPERVAQNFCAQTGVSTDNLPAIVTAIREQIANL